MLVTLVLADADTTKTVDELLRLFGVYVLLVSCLCFGSRVIIISQEVSVGGSVFTSLVNDSLF